MKLRTLILIIASFGNSAVLFSQCDFYKDIKADTSYLIKYKGYIGYIFPENYHGDIIDKSVVTFKLTIDQVEKIERILYEQYNEAFFNDPRVSKNYKGVKNIESYLREFDRQYLGYINEEGNISALIILACRKGKGTEYFQCFDKVMSIGVGDFYGRNQRCFSINLDKKLLTLP